MTFQERWGEGPPVGPAELLTPEEVRFFDIDNLSLRSGDNELLTRLCRDYLTLWDELQNERSISDRLLQRVAELEKNQQPKHPAIHD